MTYAELDAKLQGRCAQTRKLGNNTWAIRRDSGIGIRYHHTLILEFFRYGDVVVDVRNYFTITTKQRLNQYLPTPWSVRSFRGRWVLCVGYQPLFMFQNGMEIHADGHVSGAESYYLRMAFLAKEKHLRRVQRAAILLRCWVNENGRYCNLFLNSRQECAHHGPLAMPGQDTA